MFNPLKPLIMAKRFGEKNFYIEIPNGNKLALYCWCTPSRMYAYVRHCWNPDTGLEVRETIYNRTWECFEFESIIQMLGRKMRKNRQSQIADFLDGWCKAEEKRSHDETNAFVEMFKAAHDSLTNEQKEMLANSDITINSKEQAENVMTTMKMMSALNKLFS